MNVTNEKLGSNKKIYQDLKLRNRASLDSALRDVGEAQSRANMFDRRHSAVEVENTTLRSELRKAQNEVDMRDREIRRSASKISELEYKLNLALNFNPGQGDFKGRVHSLTNLLRESEWARAIAEDKAATSTALANEVHAVNQFWIGQVGELFCLSVPVPGSRYRGGNDPQATNYGNQYGQAYESPGTSTLSSLHHRGAPGYPRVGVISLLTKGIA